MPFPLCNDSDPLCQDSSSLSSPPPLLSRCLCVVGQFAAGSPPPAIPLHSLVMTLKMTEAAGAVSCQCLQAPTSVLERCCLTSLSAALGTFSTRSARLGQFQRVVHWKQHKMTLQLLARVTAVICWIERIYEQEENGICSITAHTSQLNLSDMHYFQNNVNTWNLNVR